MVGNGKENQGHMAGKSDLLSSFYAPPYGRRPPAPTGHFRTFPDIFYPEMGRKRRPSGRLRRLAAGEILNRPLRLRTQRRAEKFRGAGLTPDLQVRAGRRDIHWEYKAWVWFLSAISAFLSAAGGKCVWDITGPCAAPEFSAGRQNSSQFPTNWLRYGPWPGRSSGGGTLLEPRRGTK